MKVSPIDPAGSASCHTSGATATPICSPAWVDPDGPSTEGPWPDGSWQRLRPPLRGGLRGMPPGRFASEFGRDMITDGQPDSTANDQSASTKDLLQKPEHDGQHRHFTGGSSVVLFGGGVRRGHVHGRTADERPCVAVENPVTVGALHATLFTAMGISPKTMFEIEGRPFYATEDGHGKPVEAIFG